MIPIDSDAYASYEQSGLQNVEFTTAPNAQGTVLDAWIESNASNTATDTVYWVKLPNGIPASSSITIYMNFMPNSVMSSSGPTGEAPQLSSTYGQYDDGASVFSLYSNFYDTLAGYSAYTNAGSFTPTPTTSPYNNVELMNNAYSSGAYILSPNNINPGNYILQTYWSYSGEADGFSASLWGNPNTIYHGGGGDTPGMSGGLTYHYEFYIYGGGTPPSGNPNEAAVYSLTGNDAGTLITSASASGLGTYYVYSQIAFYNIGSNSGTVAIYSSSATSTSIANKIEPAGLYSSTYQSTASFSSISLSPSPILFGAGTGGHPAYIYIYWALIRAYPPNGVMPSVSVAPASLPSGIIEYVPITLTNSQSSATPAPFQQMINITESSFSSYINYNNNFANFEYFYANGTIIPAWIESNNSGKLITWVKLAKGIPASSSLTIYLGFASKTTNLLSSSGTSGIGEAPQLSSTYAEYDDGVSVFNNYWNFAGTSTPSGINVYTSSGSVAFNNGVTIKGGTSTSGGENGVATSASFSQPIIVDYYGTQSTSPSGDSWGWNEVGFSNYLSGSDGFPAAGGTYTLIDFENGYYAEPKQSQGGTVSNGGLSAPSGNLFSASVWTHIYTSSTYYTYQNYVNNAGYVTGASNTASLPFEIEVGNNEASYVSSGMTVYWLRTRAYPPNGVMPSVSVAYASLPSGIIEYVPITLTNSQSSATPAPFQQMINITESTFSSYINYNNNFANFEYFYANGTVIPAWIESNNSGKLITWVKLAKGIPASSSLTIYLGFASKTTNLLSSSGTTGIGEAPQLSSTYGQYDNGANVFTNYWNFAGTSLPAGFTSGVSSDGTLTLNNGLTLGTGTSDNPSYAYILSTSTYAPQIVEFYLSRIPTNPGGYGGIGTDWGFSSSTSPGPDEGTNNSFKYLIGGEIWSAAGKFTYELLDSNTNEGHASGSLSTGVYGTYINPLALYYNYASKVSSTTAITSSNYLLLGLSSPGSGAGTPEAETIQVNWFRTRAYPPNGVMPSVSFGSATSV